MPLALRTGVDLVEIDRIQHSLDRFGDRFLQRIFTPQEISLCAGNLPSLAARFAAKEAVAKAFGTGIGAIAFTDIEILRNSAGAPVLTLHGPAQDMAQTLGLRTWALSLSHTHTHAIAFVVASSD